MCIHCIQHREEKVIARIQKWVLEEEDIEALTYSSQYTNRMYGTLFHYLMCVLLGKEVPEQVIRDALGQQEFYELIQKENR
jgi:hypothetical protein